MAQQLQTFTLAFIESLVIPPEEIDEIMENMENDPDSIFSLDRFLYVILDKQVLDLKSFVLKHPGGATAILQFVGKDSTDAFHSLHSGRAKQHAKQFIIGNIQ